MRMELLQLGIELEQPRGVLRRGRVLRESVLVGRLLSGILPGVPSAVLPAAETAAATAAGLASTTEREAATTDTVAFAGAGKTGPAAATTTTRNARGADDLAGSEPRGEAGAGNADNQARSGRAASAARFARGARVCNAESETGAEAECVFGDGGRTAGKRARKPEHECAGSATDQRG
jgi:hypothetical protein